jgi:hypothetical protein
MVVWFGFLALISLTALGVLGWVLVRLTQWVISK